MTPTLIIFSSGKSLPVVHGIRDNLKDTFSVDVWSEGFFDELNTIPLWVFLKKLMCYDFAVVVLGDDDVRKKAGSNTKEVVPRDNVVFELGAAMARLGPQKTFILAPSSPKVTLPTYFRGVLKALEYDNRPDGRGNYQSATGSACETVKRHFKTLNEEAFHSDLPAQGLAVGYFTNFIARIYEGLKEQQELDLPHKLLWKPENGFSVTTFIPDEILNVSAVDMRLRKIASKTTVRLSANRDAGIYALSRSTAEAPLHIIDIPTTLLTSSLIIEKVDAFWGSFGDKHFQHQLQQRELVSFARKLRALLKESQYDDSICFVEPLSSLKDHVQKLQSTKPTAP